MSLLHFFFILVLIQPFHMSNAHNDFCDHSMNRENFVLFYWFYHYFQRITTTLCVQNIFTVLFQAMIFETRCERFISFENLRWKQLYIGCFKTELTTFYKWSIEKKHLFKLTLNRETIIDGTQFAFTIKCTQ